MVTTIKHITNLVTTIKHITELRFHPTILRIRRVLPSHCANERDCQLLQRGAAPKYARPHRLHRIRNRKLRQIRAVLESAVSDFDQSFRQNQLLYVASPAERDRGNPHDRMLGPEMAGDFQSAVYRPWRGDDRGLAVGGQCVLPFIAVKPEDDHISKDYAFCRENHIHGRHKREHCHSELFHVVFPFACSTVFYLRRTAIETKKNSSRSYLSRGRENSLDGNT